MRKHPLLMLAPALMLVFLALLYAGDKKPTPIQIERVKRAQGGFEKERLIERLNHAPEYARLPAQEKVRVLVRELRRLRAPGAVKARKSPARTQAPRLEMKRKPKFDLTGEYRP